MKKLRKEVIKLCVLISIPILVAIFHFGSIYLHNKMWSDLGKISKEGNQKLKNVGLDANFRLYFTIRRGNSTFGWELQKKAREPATDEMVIKVVPVLKELKDIKLPYVYEARLEDTLNISISKSKITDRSLEALDTLDNIRYLDLSHTKITNEGLRKLKNMKKLQALILEGMQIDKELAKDIPVLFPNLRSLRFRDWEMLKEDKEELKKSMPELSF